ncbi:MAG: PRC-barrel domain-containing protein [Hyphomicrobiaceae bacterium]
MKTALAGIAVALLATTAAPAFAQDQGKIPPGMFFRGQQADQYLARNLLLFAKVRGSEGKIIGDIEDLILTEDNRVIGVIMGVGGFLGAGEKRIGVRLGALQIKHSGNSVTVTLPVTRDVLKALPAYKRARPPKTLLERAMEKAKELADKTTATSSDAYDKAKKEAGPALQKAREKAGEAYEKGKEAVQGAVEKAKEAAQPKAQ